MAVWKGSRPIGWLKSCTERVCIMNVRLVCVLCNLLNNLNCIDLLLVLLQISTRVCVLLDYIVFRSACDYYLEKRSWRRPRRRAELAAVHHVLPPPVGGDAPLYKILIHTPSPTDRPSISQRNSTNRRYKGFNILSHTHTAGEERCLADCSCRAC